jgi:tRNA A37 threonylcarbamoyladenosine biosynthesis protein TsaE
MDLYRLSGKPEDLLPLNLSEVFANDVSLIEWPQRLGIMVPSQRLELTLEIISSGVVAAPRSTSEEEEDCMPRRVTLTPIGKHWEDRLSMIKEEGYVDDWILEEAL